MTRLLLILLLLLVGCKSTNYNHCDLYSEYSEECADILIQCEEVSGTNTIIDNDDFENNSACCCVYD